MPPNIVIADEQPTVEVIHGIKGSGKDPVTVDGALLTGSTGGPAGMHDLSIDQAMNARQPSKSRLQSAAPIGNTDQLPAGRARLMAFIADAESKASLQACLSHLSFADATVRRGGIARAIQHLGVERSPESLIVDISGTELPALRVHDLADSLRAGGDCHRARQRKRDQDRREG